jgi:hypothetical protein
MYSKKSELTKKEQGWLHLLDEELVLPPLPPDFISNVLALLGIPSDAPSIEDDTEPATATPSSDTPEELYQYVLEAEEIYQRVLEARTKEYNKLVKETDKLLIEDFRRAAVKGDANAQFVLGTMYADGLGVPQDYKTAAKWLRMAALQGHIKSSSKLSTMYADGLGVPQDSNEAAYWAQRASEPGVVLNSDRRRAEAG